MRIAIMRVLDLTTFAALSWCVLACNSDVSQVVTTNDSMSQTQKVRRDAVRKELILAQGGRTYRGIEDEFLRIEGEIPGFGGLYIRNSDKKVVAHLTDLSRSTSLRTALISRSSNTLKDVLNTVDGPSDILIEQGSFSFSQLVADQGILSDEFGPSLFSIDADEEQNRLSVEVGDTEARTRIFLAAQRVGIPEAEIKVTIVASRPPSTLTTDSRTDYPMGGFKIQAYTDVNCTLGYNLKSNGNPGYNIDSVYFVTAGHCYNQPAGTSGVTGFPVGQPVKYITSDMIGTIVYNAPWNETVNCAGYTKCTQWDGMIGQYNGSRYPVYAVAGSSGTTPPFTLEAVYSPIYTSSDPAVGTSVRKVGITTGVTIGTIAATCVNQAITYGTWGTAMNLCTDKATARADAGDSGGPVYSNPSGQIKAVGHVIAKYSSGTGMYFAPYKVYSQLISHFNFGS